MKDKNKYRFSLQFNSTSDENIQVGEFLESLGNKKSAFIVKVIVEYLAAHPEISESNVQINVGYKNINKKELIKIIKNILNDKTSLHNKGDTVKNTTNNSDSLTPELNDNDIDKMLGNLNVFSSE